MSRYAYLFLLFLSGFPNVQAQLEGGGARVAAEVPERELRGVWLATVLNIDYPSLATPDATTLKLEFREKLTALRKVGFNTLFVQVRPAGDALYPTELAPWSQWLTGRQGSPPVPADFDPLAFMIEEAHAQAVELHAWVNPYRLTMSLDTFNLAPNHLFHQRRDWVRQYGSRLYLDPGLPEVRRHLGQVIAELVSNYDLDGIHFDDYFYPYPIPGEVFPDEPTYFRYGRGRALGDWRRSNVDQFVAETYNRIKTAKPWMQFGISPYGVWRNRAQDPLNGSDSQASVSSYDDLYGDAIGWAQRGHVDYLIPQLYWSIDFPPASHATLARWWAQSTPSPTRLYVGHAAYKVTANPEPAWNDPQELPRQVRLNRRTPRLSGSVYFSAKSILQNSFGLLQNLSRQYATPSLFPERTAPATAPLVPVATKVYKPKATEKGKLIVWEIDKNLPEQQVPHYFAVYRSTGKGERELIHRSPFGLSCRRFHYYDTDATPGVAYDYFVIPVDRYHRKLTTPVAR